MSNIQKKWLLFLICATVSFVFLFFLSYSTSPLYPYCYGSDSAQFQTIGKAWLSGLIPYRDLFDHKGPIIFLINYLGYCITGSKTGIFVIQVFSLTITFWGLILLSRLRSNSIFFNILSLLISLILISESFEGGNLTEEYCLPFIVFSLYFQIKFISNLSHLHWFTSLFWGGAIGICFLTRATNAISICCGLLLILYILLIRHRFTEILLMIFYSLLGFFFVFIPFSIYFYLNDSFYQFIYATLIYNVEYKKHMVSWLSHFNFENLFDYFIYFFSSYSLLLIAIITFLKNNYIFSLFCLLSGLAESYIFLSGSLYPHYAMICLPQLILVINEIAFFSKKKFLMQFKSFFQSRVMHCHFVFFCFFYFIIFFILVFILIHNTARIYKISSINYTRYQSYSDKYSILKSVNCNNSIIMYGDDKDFYLINDITPSVKYFILQEWHSKFSDFVSKDVEKVLDEGNVLCIISTHHNSIKINRLLEKKYLIDFYNDKYVVYRLKNNLLP